MACNQCADSTELGAKLEGNVRSGTLRTPHVEVIMAGLSLEISLTNDKVTPQGHIQVYNISNNLKRQEEKPKYGCRKDNLG